jgi:hypothetical protein
MTFMDPKLITPSAPKGGIIIFRTLMPKWKRMRSGGGTET